jgi:acetyltransferase
VALNVMNATGVRDTFEDLLATVKRLQPAARINGVTIQPMSGKRSGREIYIGVTTDEAFGPVIAFGAGGTMIELIQDRAMELPPLNQFLARRLVERSRAAKMLDEFRGSPAVDRAAIEQVLLRVSDMVCALPQLREMDINPLVVDEAGVVAVDARIVVDQPLAIGHAQPQGPQAVPGVTPHLATGPFSHLAILPYPTDAAREWPLKGGGQYTVRPIQPDDAEMLQSFVKRLSPEARYFRFVSAMPEMPPSMLARYTLIDYDREMALVAVVKTPAVAAAPATASATAEGPEQAAPAAATEQIIGVSRYITNPDQTTCEFSLAVSDELKGQGIGTRLMLSITELARAKGLNELQGLVLTDNQAMLRLMRHLGFSVAAYAEDPDFRLVRLGL